MGGKRPFKAAAPRKDLRGVRFLPATPRKAFNSMLLRKLWIFLSKDLYGSSSVDARDTMLKFLDNPRGLSSINVEEAKKIWNFLKERYGSSTDEARDRILKYLL